MLPKMFFILLFNYPLIYRVYLSSSVIIIYPWELHSFVATSLDLHSLDPPSPVHNELILITFLFYWQEVISSQIASFTELLQYGTDSPGYASQITTFLICCLSYISSIRCTYFSLPAYLYNLVILYLDWHLGLVFGEQ